MKKLLGLLLLTLILAAGVALFSQPLVNSVQAQAAEYSRSDFNLTSMCKPSDIEGSLRIRNNSEVQQDYTLRLVGGGTSTGTAPVGDTLKTVDWNLSSETWILQIAGYSFTKAIGNNPICEPTPTPSPEVTPTPTPVTVNTGGQGDGRSDGRSDGLSSCPSCTQAPQNQGQVLGASTGPQVLGLSTTSGEENSLLQLVQLFGALASAGLGFTFFKKNG